MLAQPEEVGRSSQRLERMRVHFKRYIDAGKLLAPDTRGLSEADGLF